MIARDIIASDTRDSLPGQLSKTGWELPADMPFEVWCKGGEFLSRVDSGRLWWVGDWSNYGESRYGESHAEAIALTGLDYGTVRNCKYVAGQIELSRRRDNLTWSHHAEVAPLDPDEQDEWLTRADENHWTRQQLREWIKGAKSLPEPGSRELEPVPLLRFCQPDLSAATIVTLILRVAFPDAATALDATYGGGAFWDGSAHVAVTGVDLNPARAPSGAADFRNLPYPDASFDVVLFDPPHLADAGDASVMRERYGTYVDADLQPVIQDGCREAWRVARLGIIVKVTDHIHGQRFTSETDWVRTAIDCPLYDVVYQTRAGAFIDPKWEGQLSAYNNGSTYLIFRKDGPLHVRRSA